MWMWSLLWWICGILKYTFLPSQNTSKAILKNWFSIYLSFGMCVRIWCEYSLFELFMAARGGHMTTPLPLQSTRFLNSQYWFNIQSLDLRTTEPEQNSLVLNKNTVKAQIGVVTKNSIIFRKTSKGRILRIIIQVWYLFIIPVSLQFHKIGWLFPFFKVVYVMFTYQPFDNVSCRLWSNFRNGFSVQMLI